MYNFELRIKLETVGPTLHNSAPSGPQVFCRRNPLPGQDVIEIDALLGEGELSMRSAQACGLLSLAVFFFSSAAWLGHKWLPPPLRVRSLTPRVRS